MFRTFGRIAGLIGIVGILVSCADGNYSSPKGSITAAQASTLASLTTASSPTKAVQVNTSAAPNGLPTGVGRDGTLDTCTTYDPTTTTDADSDGTPLTQKTTWDCTDASDGRGTTYTRQGTRTITDKDDTVANGGYKYEYDMTGSYTSTTSRNYTGNFEYKGYFELTKSARVAAHAAGRAGDNGSRAGTWSYKTDWTGSSSTTSTSNTSRTAWGHQFEFSMTQTTRDDEESSGEGTASFDGYWGYASTGDSRSTAIDVVFRVKSSGLQWQRGDCTNFYKAGNITWTDGDGNEMKWTYTSCTDRTVTFNGGGIGDS